MKRRLLCLLLALVLVVGMMPVVTAAEEELLFRSVWTNSSGEWEWEKIPRSLKDEHDLLPSHGNRVALYYGTKENCQELTGGTLTSSNDDVIWVDTRTESGITYYQISAQKFGTATLTYTNDTGTYTADVTIGLTEGGEFYSERSRTEKTWLESISYDAENGTTVWLMSKEGFSAQEVQSLYVYLENKLIENAATAVARDEAAEVPVYDVCVRLPENEELTQDYSELRVETSWSSFWKRVKYKTEPGLMFKLVRFNNNMLEEDDRINSIVGGDSNPMPGDSYRVNLYYGTEEDYIPLTGGTVTSSNPEVATMELATQNGATFYQFRGNGFGTTTLTYTDGTNTYSTDMAIQLRAWGDFYAEQSWSTEAWLGQACYDPENGTTMWYMSRDGFEYADAQAASSFTVDGEKFGVVTAVKRDETVEDALARYDFKIELPAGKTFTNDRPRAEFIYRNGNDNSDLKIIYPPALMFRYMYGNNNSLYEDTSQTPEQLTDLDLSVDNMHRIRLYYGTTDSYEALDWANGTFTSSDTNVLQVRKKTNGVQDGQPCLEFEGISVGKATLTCVCGEVTYTTEIQVDLPENGFYRTQERTPENLLPNNFSVLDLTDNTVWVLSKDGFTKAELATTTITLGDEEISYDNVLRENENYDIKITLDTSTLDADGAELRVTREEDWGTYYVANTWLEVLQSGQAAYVGDYVVGFAFPVGDNEDFYEFNEGNWRLGNSTDEPKAEVYNIFRDTYVKAATKNVDEAGGAYYEIDEDVTADIQISRIWIVPVSGNKNGFSFSQDACVQELTGDDLSLNNQIYVRQGTAAGAMLCMQIQLTVDGETVDQEIRIAMSQEVISITNWDRPDNDTVADLNAFLMEQAKNLEKGAVYHLNLGPEYTGTIEIPAAFNHRDCDLYVHGRSNGTILNGALHLNNATIGQMRDVHFKATEAEKVGIYGGSVLNMVHCTFQNYQLAINASFGMVTLTEGNVLISNEIAYRLDVAKATANGANMNPWQNNTFINNGIALQALSFTKHNSPYSTRIYESNFLGNGVDFDIQTDATMYFYRNYFSDWNRSRKNINLNALSNANTHSAVFDCLTPREPLVGSTTATVKINTNPRWFYPVRGWWKCSAKITDIFGEDYDCIEKARSPVLAALMAETQTDGDTTSTEEPYVNYLTADWERETNILNSMAGTLALDAAAFESAGEKSIAVLDDMEQTIGTWTFKTAQDPALMSEMTDTFNAQLIKGWKDDEWLVTVADSAVLSRQAAFLTIPCGNVDWSGAKVTGPDGIAVSVEWDAETKTVTFPVTAGGTYTIAAKSVPGSLLINDDFTLGFGSYQDEGQENPELLIMQTRDDDNNGGWFELDGEYEGYVPLRTIRVRAGRPSDDSHAYYDEAEDVTIQVQKIWIEHLEGEENTFSFSSDSLVTEVTGQNDVQLYAMDGQAGRIRLWADVKLVVNGKELDETFTISGRMKFQPIMLGNEKYFESLEALEAYLNDPPQPFEDRMVYHFYLKSGKHKGTLTLPENFGGPHIYLSGMPNGSTTIEGGIDLNNGSLISVSEISFVAPAETDTKAIYNGGVGVISNCSFYNYDVALDSSSAGQVGALQGDLFVNNTVAVRADTAKATKISEAWMDKNTFINNKTAIQVLSLSNAIGPFAYRVTNSNFINNGTDFDLDHAGSYFFYKNYFGKYIGKDVKPGKSGDPAETDLSTLNLDKILQARSLNSLNKVLQSRNAIVTKADGVTATTNPRWAYPVVKWWYKDVLDEAAVFGDNTLVSEPSLFSDEPAEEEYVNYLTSDWDGTEILNEEAGNLLLDARAFNNASDMAIDVVSVDKNTGTKTVVGTWTFQAAQTSLLSDEAAPAAFHAGVTVNIGENSATVKVEDSDVLRNLQPTFTVPAMLNSVHVVGPDDCVQEVHAANGTLTAKAVCGGTYTILPYADLAKAVHEDGSVSVVVAEEFDGKQVLVVSYDEFGKFLGLVPADVEKGKAIKASPMEDAALLKLFLVESMTDMTPKTAAVKHDVK